LYVFGAQDQHKLMAWRLSAISQKTQVLVIPAGSFPVNTEPDFVLPVSVSIHRLFPADEDSPPQLQELLNKLEVLFVVFEQGPIVPTQ
jgi:hypothetical protein